MAGGPEELNIDKVKEYAANSSKVGVAIESLLKHDGWQIFLALYRRRKNDIKEKRDYEDIVDFRADRKALDIVDDLFGELDGLMEDAEAAQKTLVDISEDGPPKERGIMLIESMEGTNRES